MVSEAIADIEFDTDLSEIDEAAIPILCETIDTEDDPDMEPGSDIDLTAIDTGFIDTLQNPLPLDDAPLADDSIPLLTETTRTQAIDDTPSQELVTASHASVALPGNELQAPDAETAPADDDAIEIDSELFAHADAIQRPVTTTNDVITPSLRNPKKENPFLPQHILDRLQGSGRNLVEEIARSSAALEACTALLRTRAATDRLLSSATRLAAEDQSLVRKQKLVDELVDDYLPLIAAELRRRLHKMLDE